MNGHSCLALNEKSTVEKIQRGNFTPAYEQISEQTDVFPRRPDATQGNSSAAKLAKSALILGRPAENELLWYEFKNSVKRGSLLLPV